MPGDGIAWNGGPEGDKEGPEGDNGGPEETKRAGGDGGLLKL